MPTSPKGAKGASVKVKVAVASSDGKMVNQHFGHAKQFLIFELSQESFDFLELRDNVPTCNQGRHESAALDRATELIGDCKYVIASQIGQGAAKALLDRGIRAHVDADFIESALAKLLSSGKLKYVLQRKEG
jgi:predicted Fe-Mo cluster-binding NifX family protein